MVVRERYPSLSFSIVGRCWNWKGARDIPIECTSINKLVLYSYQKLAYPRLLRVQAIEESV